MFKRILLATALLTASAGIASAAPIAGSFSLSSFGGSYVGGTAMTATGLDFGLVLGSTGNGYGINGSALVGNGVGSFASLTGKLASIADMSLGATANPYMANPFISFGLNSSVVMNFNDASISRTSTSITVSGSATFTDGNPADTTSGLFSLSTSSQQGNANSVNFTFTSNASTSAVPEPVSIVMLGTGLLGLGIVRGKRRSA